jgi:lipopolysaccharide biosynthesis glycosyltransferase
MFRVFIGFDRRYPVIAHVAAYSIRKHATMPVHIQFLELDYLKNVYGFERVPDDPNKPASTEFAYSRFLVPRLCDYTGTALFLDSDMLCLADMRELAELDMGSYAVRCVKHEYDPTPVVKMYGAAQQSYPRKNWSSLMLMDCAKLHCWTKMAVERNAGAWLHRFEPIHDALLGDIDKSWNDLDNFTPGVTKMIHFTSGMECHDPKYKDAPGMDLWRQYHQEMLDKYTRNQ